MPANATIKITALYKEMLIERFKRGRVQGGYQTLEHGVLPRLAPADASLSVIWPSSDRPDIHPR